MPSKIVEDETTGRPREADSTDDAVQKEREDAKKYNLDDLRQSFGDDGLDEGEGKAEAGDKPGRDEMNKDPVPQPPSIKEAKLKVTERNARIKATEASNKKKKDKEDEAIRNRAARKLESEKQKRAKSRKVTESDGHTFIEDKPICMNCGLDRDKKITEVCFGKPLAPVTKKKFMDGLISYNGTWLAVEK